MASAVSPSTTMIEAVKWEPQIVMSIVVAPRECRGEPLTPINLFCVQGVKWAAGGAHCFHMGAFIRVTVAPVSKRKEHG